MKKNYKVTGMSCAACSARVQKAVSNVNGVAECNVNLLTGDMTVDGQFDGSSVIAAVKSRLRCTFARERSYRRNGRV